ncbi:TetR/AcrR family transcriptional regulator [Nocardioides panacisoli]|uniref:HTH tetR-type domain-containing protein n=1 Tax=Nocardioides panacisoli TaxID=627624 RepID=A0ABP7IEL3_9ACTN
MPRRYEMSSRSAAVQRTREAILDAATELFTPAWFDQVTLADIARRAGVSQQTVANHFGSKIGLYRAGLAERFVPMLTGLRGEPEPGDVDGVVAAVMRDYERTGDGTWRTVALADREPDLADIAENGRRWHRTWVERAFEPQLSRCTGADRNRVATLLVTVLDVVTWKKLRRDEGLSEEAVGAHLRVLVAGILGQRAQ